MPQVIVTMLYNYTQKRAKKKQGTRKRGNKGKQSKKRENYNKNANRYD